MTHTSVSHCVMQLFSDLGSCQSHCSCGPAARRHEPCCHSIGNTLAHHTTTCTALQVKKLEELAADARHAHIRVDSVSVMMCRTQRVSAIQRLGFKKTRVAAMLQNKKS